MSYLLKLDIDFDGEPFLKVDGHFASSDVKEKLMHQFISKALERGLVIESKSDIGSYCHIKTGKGE